MEAVAEQDAAEFFTYQPLDLKKAAIRLVRLLPDLSPRGLIHCKISHDTIEASYTCLSYRWGPPEPNGLILINAKLFSVRQNLLDFLDMARQSANSTDVFWIDALCIDQSQVLERNHQVAQMGKIYSHASCVYVWLGSNPDLRPAFQMLIDWTLFRIHPYHIAYDNQSLLEDYLCGNSYWERAWIVQEIFLARTVLIWLDTQCVSFEDLYRHLDRFFLSWENTPISRFNLLPKAVVGTWTSRPDFDKTKSLYHGASLPVLLANFREMKCEIPRDRVFSLLSMSGNAGSYSVDYSSTDVDACFAILEQCGDLQCLCVPRLVAESMGSSEGLLKQFETQCCVIEIPAAPGNISISMARPRYRSSSITLLRDIEWEWYCHTYDCCLTVENVLRYIGKWQALHEMLSATGSMEYDGKEECWYADDFNARMSDGNMLIVEISLSALHKLTRASPESCASLKLGGLVSESGISIHVKRRLTKRTQSVSS